MSKFIADQLEGLKTNRDALAKSLKARQDREAPNDPQVMADEARDIAKFEARIAELQPKIAPVVKAFDVPVIPAKK